MCSHSRLSSHQPEESVVFTTPLLTKWSVIPQVNIFRDATVLMVEFVKQIREQGFDLQYLDIGGGLGVDYYHRSVQTPFYAVVNIIAQHFCIFGFFAFFSKGLEAMLDCHLRLHFHHSE